MTETHRHLLLTNLITIPQDEPPDFHTVNMSSSHSSTPYQHLKKMGKILPVQMQRTTNSAAQISVPTLRITIAHHHHYLLLIMADNIHRWVFVNLARIYHGVNLQAGNAARPHFN
ncbi:Hypothetical predicted protein [Olea europaea subsp. europaea]|uniref:Uncharacterized protein n=1 Tax=Olea europaea subsp. europaea TaxID=158383 RepID=A0A8S0VAP8_OLEEU|nr:Hypothetical predicted protein [Olea europaea subsp. europaea]